MEEIIKSLSYGYHLAFPEEDIRRAIEQIFEDTKLLEEILTENFVNFLHNVCDHASEEHMKVMLNRVTGDIKTISKLENKVIYKLIALTGEDQKSLSLVSKYNILGVSDDDLLKYGRQSMSEKKYIVCMKELIKKDASLVQKINITNMLFIISMLRKDYDLLVLIDENYNWSGSVRGKDVFGGKKDFISSNSFVEAYSKHRKFQVIDVVCFLVIYEDKSFRYFVDKYESDIDQSMILAYAIYQYYPDKVKYLLDKGFTLNNTITVSEPLHEYLQENEDSFYELDDLIDLLFDNLDHDELFKMFKNVGRLPGEYATLLTIKLAECGYGKQLKEYTIEEHN